MTTSELALQPCRKLINGTHVWYISLDCQTEFCECGAVRTMGQLIAENASLIIQLEAAQSELAIGRRNIEKLIAEHPEVKGWL